MPDTILADGFNDSPWWWEDTGPFESAAAEPGADADVVIVGSGYAGLSCAHELARAGHSVIVVDAGPIGSGASTRNAGFLSGRAGVSKQINLEALVGKQHAGRIFDEADAAYEYLQQLVASENIECSLSTTGRFVAAHTPAAYDKLAAKAREYNSGSGNRFYMVPRSEQHDYVDSDYWYGGMFTESAGLIHPSRYHRGLVDLCLGLGVTLVSNSRVVGIVDRGERKLVVTDHGEFGAREVVLATNGYTDELSPWHRCRLVPISSTAVVSEELGVERVDALLPKHCAVIDTRRVICWARPSPDRKRLLFGGRARFSPLGARESARVLHQQLVDMFPQMSDIRVTHAWSGYMAFTFDFMPKIGIHEGIHYALGCNGGCGIVMMSWLGRRVGQKILGKAETSAFEGLTFQAQPFYSGKPWFLPIVGNWWRLRDWLELRQARKSPA